eukprot:5205420-Pyramimonas_sp.AAC.1
MTLRVPQFTVCLAVAVHCMPGSGVRQRLGIGTASDASTESRTQAPAETSGRSLRGGVRQRH